MEFNVEQTLANLKKQVNDLKTKKIRLEAEMQHLVQEKQEILKAAEDLGLDAKQLDQHIAELETDVLSQIQLLERNLDECGAAARPFTQ